MSTTYEDIMYDTYLDFANEAEYESAVEKFKKESLKRYFLKNPRELINAKLAADRAKDLLKNGYNTPSFVFSSTAYELIIKNLILKPVFYGLIMDDDLADQIVDDLFNKSNKKYIKQNYKLLERFAKKFGGTDIKKFTGKKNLIKEYGELSDMRNDIVHGGSTCAKKDSERNIRLAKDFYIVANSIIERVGLKFDKDTWEIK